MDKQTIKNTANLMHFYSVSLQVITVMCKSLCDCWCLLCVVGFSINLTPEDSQWVGAWWIGFLISGSLSFLIAIPLSAFPKSLPGIWCLEYESLFSRIVLSYLVTHPLTIFHRYCRWIKLTSCDIYYACSMYW